MPAKSTPAGYSVFDFLTRIIPGLIVILPLFVGLLLFGPSIILDVQISILLLSVLGLIIGEFIDFLRSSLFRVPSPFKQVLYHHTRDEEVLSWLDKVDLWIQRKLPTSLQSKFLTSQTGRETIFNLSNSSFKDEFEDQFNLSLDSTSPHTLYSTFLNHMDSRMASRTRRYYTLRIFSQNLMAATLGAGFVSLVVASLNLGDPKILAILFISIIILTIVFEVALIFSSVSYPLVDLLIIDYYLYRLETSDGLAGTGDEESTNPAHLKQ